MRTSRQDWQNGLLAISLGVLVLLALPGCGPAALLIMSVAGGAAAVSGEPQRVYNTQGADFDEQRIAVLRSGGHTSDDVVNLLGNPQTKVFTNGSEEWAYRYYVPPSLFRSGMEKILTIRFQAGKVQEVRYTISAL
jgi:outer membrane protein assembly factor BamE (lipoprotein component of BamABCDE complex)